MNCSVRVFACCCLFFLVACVLVKNSDAQAVAADVLVDRYASKIKPVLKERCFACHGALKQEADLRLDTVSAMKEHGILESGDLIDRLTSTDDDFRMPPEGEPLSDEELAAIKQWLAADAPAPENEIREADPTKHWAFQKIVRPAVPSSEHLNAIDAFLSARQIQNGLKPQSVARRTLLLRRLYLDLTGLPPTLGQLQSTEPLDQIIASLLDSPQYGERWGRHWMDVWRYSDWYGLGAQLRNSQKHIWHWRDWIVDSLNDDKGYDQMVREMLAGDEITPQDPQTVVATGFLARNYYLFNRTTWLDNTIEHTNKAFLGLTMNCAKCHDHKYDPIDHEDYYRFRAIFEPHHVRLDAWPGETDYAKNGLPRVYDDAPERPTYLHLRGDPSKPQTENPINAGAPKFLASFASAPVSVDLPVEAWAPGTRDFVQADQLASATSKIKVAQEKLAKIELKLKQKQESSQNTEKRSSEPADGVSLSDDFQRSRPEVWQTVGEGWRYQGGLLSQTQPTTDRVFLRSKKHHPRDFELTLSFQTTGGQRWKSTGIRFDVDESGKNSHTVYASAVDPGSKVQLAQTVDGRQTYPPNAKRNRPIQLNREYNLNVQVRDDLINVSLDNQFLFAYRLPRRTKGGIELFAFDSTADFYSIDVKPLAADVKLHSTDKKATVVDDAKIVDLAKAELRLAQTELSALKARIAADNAMLRSSVIESGGTESAKAAGLAQLKVQLAQAEVDLLTADAAKKTAATKKRNQAKKAIASGNFPAYAPLRGSQRALDQKTHKIQQYSPTYSRTSTGRRTALADWITHRDNPLTARVAVNHIWMRHFGTPLVDSVFDFGRRAPKPLHQDLLDYLAVELIESNWSMKHLHRLILTSDAWQRTSSNLNADSKTLAADPENYYYWRMNHRRMQSQTLRDSLLHLSGRLDLKRGGPPVKSGPKVLRRSLYLFHARDGRDKFVSTFDDADVFGCYRRSESIVPQQALAMMNSRDAIESAKQIQSQSNADLPDADFARNVFLRLLARTPSEKELRACESFLKENSDRSAFVHALLNHNDFLVIR